LDKKSYNEARKASTFTYNPEFSEKTNMKNFIKNVDKNFEDSHYSNKNFTGINIIETLLCIFEKVYKLFVGKFQECNCKDCTFK
jgi:hypothetical protein